MRIPLPYFVIIILSVAFLVAFLSKCEKKVKPEIVKEVEKVKLKVDTLKVEVVKWKEAKTKIVYRTKFDTLATIDTVLIELAKCDTIVKIDSIIIQKQDTIIKDQRVIIDDLDADLKESQKEVKKQKRKTLLTKIAAVAVVVLTILITK